MVIVSDRGHEIKKKQHSKKNMTRAERDSRKKLFLTIGVIVLLCLSIAYQAVTGLIRGEIGSENYYGQPVDPVVQLLVLVVLAIVGVVLAWQYFHKKPETKKEKRKRNKGQFFKYPHEKLP